MAEICEHLDKIQQVTPSSTKGCTKCMEMGARWFHLRLCLTCGEVGCCDSSPNRHASRHAAEHDHPIVHSFEPGEEWNWCYVDNVAFAVDGLEVNGPTSHD